jgi:hypothetical protein
MPFAPGIRRSSSGQWRLGDLVLWDNIALQHARAAVNPSSRRTLRRVVANDHVAEPEFAERRQRMAFQSGLEAETRA